MDNEDSVIVSPFEVVFIEGPIIATRDILAVVATYKERKCVIRDGDKLSIEERSPEGVLQVTGFWPALEYLEERFPYPSIFMDTPVLSAALRSITEQMLNGEATNILNTLRCANSQYAFLFRNTPTIVDFAAYALSDPFDAFWADHAARISGTVSQSHRHHLEASAG